MATVGAIPAARVICTGDALKSCTLGQDNLATIDVQSAGPGQLFYSAQVIHSVHVRKGAITSKIKHAIKHKTNPARLAQLLQPYCFSLQPMTAYRHCLSCHWLQAKTKC